MKQLEAVIQEEYLKPYTYLHDNCVTKTLRISSAARKLGKRVRIISCIALVPTRRRKNIYTINPHLYPEINGEKVDVTLDPESEKEYCKNNEVKMYFRMNVSKIEKPLRALWNLCAYCTGDEPFT